MIRRLSNEVIDSLGDVLDFGIGRRGWGLPNEQVYLAPNFTIWQKNFGLISIKQKGISHNFVYFLAGHFHF